MKIENPFFGKRSFGSDNYPNVNFGGSVQTWGLSKELAKRGHEVYIVRRSQRGGEERAENVRLVGISYKGMEDNLPTSNVFFHIFLLFSKLYFSMKSRRVIKRIDPDIICYIDRQTATFASNSDAKKV